MQGRDDFLIQLLEQVDAIVHAIDDGEDIFPELSTLKESAEVLREELRILQ